MKERLQKIIARAGHGSRRANEILIEAGRVRVNGVVAGLGDKADIEKDTITVDGTSIPKAMPQFVYIALHKPKGVLSDEDPKDPNPRPTVRDLVPVPGHLFAVGRLDYASEGLILMTNDGELANRLTHPRYEHEKEYRVQLAAHPDDDQLNAWRRGVVMEDGYKTAPARVTLDSFAGKGAWLTVVLKEGRKRQIREVGNRIGLPVFRILRVRIGTLQLGNLKPREWRYLSSEEVLSLKGLAKQDKVTRSTRKPYRNASPSSHTTERRPSFGKGGPSSRNSGRKPDSGQDAPTTGPTRTNRRTNSSETPSRSSDRTQPGNHKNPFSSGRKPRPGGSNSRFGGKSGPK